MIMYIGNVLYLWEGVCVYGKCVSLWEEYVNGKNRVLYLD